MTAIATLTLKVVPFDSDWPLDLCDVEVCATYPICKMQGKVDDFHQAVNQLFDDMNDEDRYYTCVVGCHWFVPLRTKGEDNHD